MKKNILEYLENTAKKHSDKICYTDSKREVTYKEFVENSKRIGSGIIKNVYDEKQGIIVFIDKQVSCLEAMMGVLYSGNFYTVVDVKSPVDRFNSIVKTLECKYIITDSKNLKKLNKILEANKENGIEEEFKILIYEEIIETEINKKELLEIRNKMIDTDIMYILFTSGSTGIPKGVVISYRAVISYVNWTISAFDINEKTVWGSQTPFYFSMSITDVFSTMFVGATLHIIPKVNFSFPINLIKFLNERKVNTIYWVPSALSLVANLGVLKEAEIEYLEKILFAGEVMQVKQLNMWREKLPNALFANLYGPTETTDICSYYILDREFQDIESIPIGYNCDNCNLIVIDENGKEIKQEKDENGNYIESKPGELLARGSFLAMGYYGNKEKTDKAFVQNPLHNKYPELVYKTGDIVKYNTDGNLIYISRKDFQIKHMGYRIELGEIERNIYNVDEVVLCASIYDEKEDKIVLFYEGEIEENDLAKRLHGKLLPYMIPNIFVKLQKLPYNANGKIDRTKLKKEYIEDK